MVLIGVPCFVYVATMLEGDTVRKLGHFLALKIDQRILLKCTYGLARTGLMAVRVHVQMCTRDVHGLWPQQIEFCIS